MSKMIGYLYILLMLLPGVISDATIVTSITNITVAEGQTAVLPCIVRDLGHHKVKVVWTDQYDTVLTFNRNRVIDDVRFSAPGYIDDKKTWNLHFERVKLTDHGMYYCQVNTEAAIKHGVMLTVVVPPNIFSPKLDITEINVREHDNVTLTCNATGQPEPEITWYRQHKSADPYMRTHSFEGPSQRIGHQGSTLVIRNVTRFCGGLHECRATNNVQPSAKKKWNVRVEFAPELRLSNKRIGQVIGKDTILECNVHGYPQVEVFWKFNDNKIASTKDKYELELTFQERESRLTLNLILMNIQKEDYGLYTCFAMNSLGKDEKIVELYEYMGWNRVTTTTPKPSTTIPGKLTMSSYPPRGMVENIYDSKMSLASIPKGRAGAGHRGDMSSNGRYTRPEASVDRNGENSASTVSYFSRRVILTTSLLTVLRTTFS